MTTLNSFISLLTCIVFLMRSGNVRMMMEPLLMICLLLKMGLSPFFSKLYMHPPSNNIVDQILEVLKNLPLFFSEEEGNMVGSVISLEDVE